MARRLLKAEIGAGGRLGAAHAYTVKRAGERLKPGLIDANTATYLAALQATARAFGASPPTTISNTGSLRGIGDRASISAQSIAQTQAERMATLVAEYGTRHAAQAAFATWERSQRALIVGYESSATMHAAQGDFMAHNTLTGTEHCEPTLSAGLADDCDEAIAMGEVPLGTLPDLPAHARCPHYAVRSFDPVDDPDALWLGQDS